MNNTFWLACAALVLSSSALASERVPKENKNKLADDPTKVITKFGAAYSNNYDFDDQNISFSGSLASSQQAFRSSLWLATLITMAMCRFVMAQRAVHVQPLVLLAHLAQRMGST